MFTSRNVIFLSIVFVCAVVFAASVTTDILKLRDGSGNVVNIQSPSLSADYTLTLPTDDGSSGQLLSTNGSGVLAWSTSGDTNNKSYVMENVGLGFSTDGSAVTITLKQADGSTACDGSNPCVIGFDDGDGSFSVIEVSSDTSVTLDSTATLNTTSGGTHPIYIYAVNNSGAIVIGVSTKYWDQREALSTTTLDTSADGVALYTDTGLTTKRIKLLGIWISTQATAGTWAAVTGTKLIDPVLINNFTKLTSSGLRNGFVVRAICDHSGTPSCTETDNYNWISSVTDNAVGQMTLNLFTGITVKDCRATCAGTCWTTAFGAVAATAVAVRSFGTSGALDAASTFITCQMEAY